MHDTGMESAWNMDGICVETAWNVYEICTGVCRRHGICVQEIILWSMHGICMEYVAHGIFMESAWKK